MQCLPSLLLGGLPFRILAPHSTVEVRISWIIFVLHPLGAIQIPSISDTVLQDNRFNETKLLSSVFAIKSNSSGASAATHFPRFHTNSTRYQYVLSEANAPPVTSIKSPHCRMTLCIDLASVSGSFPDCIRSQSSTYEKPTNKNSCFDIVEQNSTPKPLS